MTIKEILEKYKKIAYYGISTNPDKPAYRVPAFMQSQGYEVIPINPHADEILGKKVYRNLMDVEEEIEILDVFRPSDQTVQVVKEAIERNKANGDIKVIWLQLGIMNEEAKKLAEEHGFIFVQDKCLHIEYERYFG